MTDFPATCHNAYCSTSSSHEVTVASVCTHRIAKEAEHIVYYLGVTFWGLPEQDTLSQFSLVFPSFLMDF